MEQQQEHQREMSARTVEEATEIALRELGVSRDEVEIEVLSKGRAGFLGIGTEPARVRVRKLTANAQPAPTARVASRPAPSARPAPAREPEEGEEETAEQGEQADAAEVARVALEIVDTLIKSSGVGARAVIRTSYDSDSGGPIIDIEGEDSGLLIGRRGETLDSFQFLVNVMVSRRVRPSLRVVLDVEEYRERRRRALRQLAEKVAEKVSQTGRSITLEPMAPAERRVIHMALAEHPGVTTQSVGSGPDRKVSVLPKRAPRR